MPKIPVNRTDSLVKARSLKARAKSLSLADKARKPIAATRKPRPIGRDKLAIRPNPPSASVGKASLPRPKLYKPGKGKKEITCLTVKEPRRLSNADECIGYVVRVKPRVIVNKVDYSHQQGVIVDAWVAERVGDKEGTRTLTFHIELDKVILKFLSFRSIDWIDVPKK